jgi:membrane-bound lytic murein transglycosylase B
VSQDRSSTAAAAGTGPNSIDQAGAPARPEAPARRRWLFEAVGAMATWATWAAWAAALGAPGLAGAQEARRRARGTGPAGRKAANASATASANGTGGPPFGLHPGARTLAGELASAHGIDVQWSLQALADARHVAAVRRLIMPPPVGVPKNWQAYRERFVEPRRIAGGLEFWSAHDAWLDRAASRWGVPPEIVVAIVGVETFYGRILGSFRVIDALATLSFDFPPGRRDRSAFFRDELAHYLRWCHGERIDPLAPLGSYAGAIGLPQFMPSSILRYGVDFDGDGHVDLRASGADTVGSVANYLAAFGWKPGLPTHHAVQPPSDPADRAALLAPDILPSFTAAQLAERGARLDAAGLAHEGLLALVELENGGAPRSYVAGSTNFYAITRYNWSSYYAMAVIDLAEALRAAR